MLLVGPPATGKSTLSTTRLPGYARVNRDTLKTPEKCLAAARKALAGGQSVVIDNTNARADARRPYIELARSHSIPIRAFIMSCPREVSAHLNYFRERTAGIPHVPRVAVATFHKHYEVRLMAA